MPASLLERNAADTADLLRALPATLDEPFARAVTLLADALNAGGKLLVCGNGGSAGDAMHLATEFVCRFVADRQPYPAVCLNASGGDLTAIVNDYHFEELFARQVRAFGQPGDVLIVLTTSGKSPNIRRALQAAAERGVASLAFLGRGGGACRGLATVEILVPGPETMPTARIQEAHKLLLHSVCEGVEERLQPDQAPPIDKTPFPPTVPAHAARPRRRRR